MKAGEPPVDEEAMDYANEEAEDDNVFMAKDGHRNVADTDGNAMPVDYEAIIEGLNAKNLALEAENKRLKAMTEGAFGFSAKPQAPVKVNRLYDDCADIKFRK